MARERKPLEGIESALARGSVPTRIGWGMADTIFSSATPDYLDRCVREFARRAAPARPEVVLAGRAARRRG
jgi:hypothetical protein